MLNFMLVIHVIVAIAMVVLILIQHGKGADAGAAFSGGSAVLGTSGTTFFSRLTAILAGIFFITSLTLVVLHKAPVSNSTQLGGEDSRYVQPKSSFATEAEPTTPTTDE